MDSQGDESWDESGLDLDVDLDLGRAGDEEERMEDEEDDFDGIEDVSPSQAVLPKAVASGSKRTGTVGATLEDLFSDDEPAGESFSARKAISNQTEKRVIPRSRGK
jgi:hypothetical protein